MCVFYKNCKGAEWNVVGVYIYIYINRDLVLLSFARYLCRSGIPLFVIVCFISYTSKIFNIEDQRWQTIYILQRYGSIPHMCAEGGDISETIYERSRLWTCLRLTSSQFGKCSGQVGSADWKLDLNEIMKGLFMTHKHNAQQLALYPGNNGP